MKINKKVVSSVLSIPMLLSASVAFAADRDVYNTDASLFATANQMNVSEALKNQVNATPSNFLYAWGENYYSMNDAFEAYIAASGDNTGFINNLVEKNPVVVDQGELKVESVSAINGTVTVTLSGDVTTAPTAADFALTRTINGTSSTVNPVGMTWNAATKTASFTVGTVAETTVAQSVVYSASFKNATAVTAPAFTVAARTSSVGNIHSVVALNVSEQIVVIFKEPVEATTARSLTNYTYDPDRTAAGAVFNPTAVALNNAAVGPFAPGQVATLTFPAASIGADANGSIKIGDVTINLTSANNPTVFSNVAADADDATAVLALSAGTTAATAVTAGTSVTLAGNATDTSSSPAGVQYRLQRPDLTFTPWTTMTLADGVANEDPERFTAAINTTGFAPGAYTVQYRAVDVSGRVSATTPTGEQLFIAGLDVTAPVLTLPTAGTGIFTLPIAATAERPAYSATFQGVQLADADANVKSIEFRVQQFNALTDTFTTVQDWTAANPQDGAYDERTEFANFTTNALVPGNSYRIQVRGTDENNNVTPATTITAEIAGPGVVLDTGLATGLTAAGAAGAADGIFTVDAVAATNPTMTAGDAVAPSITTAGTLANNINTRTVQITGTADADSINNGGGDTQTVSKVEFAVYQDVDRDGSYETTVLDFTTTGVTATDADGTFDDAQEAYSINYTLPSDGAFRIVTRGTNNAGNTALSAGMDTWVDTAAPTVTVTENTATAARNDFIVTFSEAVLTGSDASDGNAGPAADDFDNYTLRLSNGQIVDAAATAVADNGTNSFIVTFGNTPTPTAGMTVNIVNVTDTANADGTGNEIAPFSYTIK